MRIASRLAAPFSGRHLFGMLLFSVALMIPVASHRLALDSAALAAEPELDEGWTRRGPLENVPEHVTDALPLSDQQNRQGWIVFEPLTDEFEGDALDTDTWLPTHPRWKGRQPAFFSPENVTVQDGRLQLTMRLEETPEELKPRGYEKYSSALVYAKRPVLYGYFETRAKPMPSAGSSSFWFANHTEDRWTEIDVFELSAKGPDDFPHRYNMNLHVHHTPDNPEHRRTGDIWKTPWPVGDDYHVYGIDWGKEEIVYYVDGVAVRRVENTHWHQPLNLMFDSETMPDWMGLPDDVDLPSTYKIDYIRAWKRGVRHADALDSPEKDAE